MAERPEDLNLPNSVVARIIKEALPDGVNVSKDARLAISKAASVFVLYATSCANNFAMQSKRKTISGPDVLEAMNEMEFERFVDPLKKSLAAFKLEQKGKKEASEKRKKEKEETNTSKSADNEEDVAMDTEAADGEEVGDEEVVEVEDDEDEVEEVGED